MKTLKLLSLLLIFCLTFPHLPPPTAAAPNPTPTDFLQEFQSIPTQGATDWEFFTIGTERYLAVANHFNGSSYDIDSKIYHWDGTSFVEFQSIPTHGAHDWEFFIIENNYYLAVANRAIGTSSNPGNSNITESKIYKWNGVAFEEFQSITTLGACGWRFFTFDANYYLAVGNLIGPSKIYKWNGVNFVEFQSIPSSGGDSWTFFKIETNYYLILSVYGGGSTHNVFSKIYKWDGAGFADFQSIPTQGAGDSRFFTINGEHYLAITNYYNDVAHNIDSKIYKWNGASFSEFQAIPTNGGHGVEFFTLNGGYYLVVDNFYDGSTFNVESKIYQWDGSGFVELVSLLTNGGYRFKFFTINTVPYLAVANWYNDTTYSLNSKIYRLNAPPSSLSLYTLLFDNAPLSTMNLDAYFQESIQSIADASRGHPEKTAVVWADRGGANPDAIYTVQNGLVTEVSAQWPGMQAELDSTNPTLLGSFLQWARATYPATKTTLTVVAHNMPVPPHTDLSQVFPPALGAAASVPNDNIFPSPMHIGVEPDYTDESARRALSTYALAEALRLGSSDGAAPFDVLDLAFCFGLTLENLYPLRAYARTVVGGANYLHFTPTMVGATFNALDPAQTAEASASAFVAAYQDHIPPTGHPYIMLALRTAPLTTTKQAWDNVSYRLLQSWSAATKDKLRQAYLASGKYDTTYCPPPDWACNTPDALVDVALFADQLRILFGDTSPVGIPANDALSALSQMPITRTVQNGTPWYAAPLTPTVNFDGYSGIGLYADFEGELLPNGQTRLYGIAHWYTRTATLGEYDHPYAFLMDSIRGVSWADVFHQYWAGANLTTTLCLPTFPPVLESGGDVAALGFTFPILEWTRVGSPMRFAPTFSTTRPVHNLWVGVQAIQTNTVVFSETIAVAYAPTGTHQIQSTQQWIPTRTGPVTLKFMVDVDGAISEVNEGNNLFTMPDLVRVFAPRPEVVAETAGQGQWFSTLTVPLSLTQVATQTLLPAERIHRLTIDVYQSRLIPGTDLYAFTRTAQLVVDPISLPQTNWPLTLPPNTQPGRVVLHIWPRSVAGGLGYPASVELNYMPPNAALALGSEHFYTLNTAANAQLTLTCQAATGAARLYVWPPRNAWTPQTQLCNGSLTIPATLAGEYLVSVAGLAAGTTYTLSEQQNVAGLAAGLRATPTTTIARARPTFLAPIPAPPTDLPLKTYLPAVRR